MWKEAFVVQFQMIHYHQNQTTVAVDVQAGNGTGNRQNTRQNFQQNKEAPEYKTELSTKQGSITAKGSEKG
jgi:hypothetical protein